MARIIESIIGHEAEIAKLTQLKEKKRWPHTLLLAGPSGIGKMKVALAFAQSFLCENSDDACGVCGSCLRVEKKQSESLRILGPDAEAAKPAIKVEAVRELLQSLSLSHLGAAQIVIIDEAHSMNTQAANALLKTLEEPMENLYFILIANDVQQFLPTMRSRAQVVRFSALRYEQMKRIKPHLDDWIYRSARGQLDRAEKLASEEGKLQREEALAILDQFCEDPHFLSDKTWKDQIKNRAWAIQSLKYWLQIVRDAAVLKTQAKKFILNTDQTQRLKNLYEISNQKLLFLCQNLISAERDISANADPVLVVENMWVKYARVD